MIFSSITFLFYFLPVFFLLYYLAAPKYKNIVILLASIFFYSWGAPRFIFAILGTTVVDFYIVRSMADAEQPFRRKLLLSFSLALNLGLLFYFKYCNFFIENIDAALLAAGAKPLTWEKVVLPIGISFYTFESLTYVVDVYRRLHQPLRKFFDYQLYIILFPKLIAGPIIRYHDFSGQVYDHTSHETIDNKLKGLYRFFIGLGKKVLIANAMGHTADIIFKMPGNELGTVTAWYGAVAYTFQIYFDFSGYSDMAIGLGLMMGFRFPENFNNPYTAVSITDFWRRWHITLGTWMRNYLYIPLGGNKVSRPRLFFNLWLVFLLSGLWHGAAWGFIVWGAYHGAFLVAERLFLGKWLQKASRFAVLYTFPVVVIGWVFFRSAALGDAVGYIGHMFSIQSSAGWQPDREFYIIGMVAVLFSFFTIPAWGKAIQYKIFYADYPIKRHLLVAFITLVLFVLSAARIAGADFNPFIYFRF
ncbi:MAG: MBOAT family protein [Taibaiella sp.]|nr:MBOAT family protein [Taibaiella sp.]